MSWDQYAEALSETTIGVGIVSREGALCGQHGDFPAAKNEILSWAMMLEDPRMARQRGVSIGGKYLYAVEYSEDFIFARRDAYCLIKIGRAHV